MNILGHAKSPTVQARAGMVLTVIVIGFLLLDASMKLLELPVVIEASTSLGWSPGSARPLGLVLLATTALYAIPRTSLIGALLLTAYLGGAVATHARIGNPLWTHIMFGVYVGMAAWAGIVLRNVRARSLLLRGE